MEGLEYSWRVHVRGPRHLGSNGSKGQCLQDSLVTRKQQRQDRWVSCLPFSLTSSIWTTCKKVLPTRGILPPYFFLEISHRPARWSVLVARSNQVNKILLKVTRQELTQLTVQQEGVCKTSSIQWKTEQRISKSYKMLLFLPLPGDLKISAGLLRLYLNSESVWILTREKEKAIKKENARKKPRRLKHLAWDF